MSGQCLNSIRTVSGQCLDSVQTVSGQCLKGVWKVLEAEIFVHTFFAKLGPSGQCMDSAWTVSRQCVDCFWKVWDPTAGKNLKKKLRNKSNYVKTVSEQYQDSVWKVSGKYLKQKFLYTHFLPSSVHLDSVWTVHGHCPDSVWTVSERYWIHPQ